MTFKMDNEDILMAVPTLGTRPEWLKRSVDSIRSQDGVACRIVIVCPPSAAGKVDNFAECEVLTCDEPGLSNAINAAWSTVGPERAVAWLGDDDLLAPGALARSLAVLDARSEVAATYGRIRYIDEHGCPAFQLRPGRLAAWYLPWGKDLVPQQGSLFRTSSVERIGGLRRDLAFAMDYDLFLRLRRVGKLAYIPHEVGAFRLHQSSITSNQPDVDEPELLRWEHHGFIVNTLRTKMVSQRRLFDRVLYRLMQRRSITSGTYWGRLGSDPGLARDPIA